MFVLCTLTVVIVSYNNCSGVPVHDGIFSESSRELNICDIAYSEAYGQTFYQLAQDSQTNCTQCHSQGGSGPWAHSDSSLTVAYLEFMDLGSDRISRLGANLRQSGGHQGVFGLTDVIVDTEQTKLQDAAVEYENCMDNLAVE